MTLASLVAQLCDTAFAMTFWDGRTAKDSWVAKLGHPSLRLGGKRPRAGIEAVDGGHFAATQWDDLDFHLLVGAVTIQGAMSMRGNTGTHTVISALRAPAGALRFMRLHTVRTLYSIQRLCVSITV